MPITEFQKYILRLLAGNRNPDSYVAGGIVINRKSNSKRFSDDIDFFHESVESVAICSDIDILELRKNGFKVDVQLSRPGFVRAVVLDEKLQQSMKLEWVTDTAFRFFPVEKDKLLGYRLHDADAAINKCLALAGRREARDVIDLIQLDNDYLCLGALCWAASGKDPGLTPSFLVEQLGRNAIITPDMLEAEHLVNKVDIKQIKVQWLRILEEARKFVESFPGKDLGCIYLDQKSEIVQRPKISKLSNYNKHYGTTKGSWPINPES